MECYLYDAVTATTLDLTDDSLAWHLSQWTPATTGLAGGRDTLTLLGRGTYDELDEDLRTIGHWLDRAARAHAEGIERIYLYHQDPGADLLKRALVRSGTIKKTQWENETTADTGDYLALATMTVDHGPAELSEEFVLKNLVENPSFEYDTDGDGTPNDWTPQGAAALSQGSPSGRPHGRYTANLRNNAATPQARSDAITVTAATNYMLSGYAAAATIDQTIYLRVYNAVGDVLLETLTITTTAVNTFVRGFAKVAVPAGCTSVYVALEGAQSVTLYFDAIYFGLLTTYGGNTYDTGMWSDYHALGDHDDWEWDQANYQPYAGGTHQNSTHREDLDVLHLPGDLAPDLALQFFGAVNDLEDCFAGAMSGPYLDRTFLSFQAENATVNGAPTLSTVAGATGPAANNCYLLPLTASGSWWAKWDIGDDDTLRLLGKQVRVYARLGNAASVGATYQVKWTIMGYNHIGATPYTPVATDYYDSPVLLNNATTYWRWCAGPSLRFPLGIVGGGDARPPYFTYLYFWAYQASGYDCYLDRIRLVGTDGYIELPVGTGIPPYLASGWLQFGDTAECRVGTETNLVMHELRGQLNRYDVEDVLRLSVCRNNGAEAAVPTGGETRLAVRPRYRTL